MRLLKLALVSVLGLCEAWTATPLRPRTPTAPRACILLQEDSPAAPPPETYDAAEARGFELYKAKEYERAIRMFELAQTLPGDGVDYTREKNSGMIGSSSTASGTAVSLP